jgi:hypothetical protein
MQLHLVILVSDGRKMLATCESESTIACLRTQLEVEVTDTFQHSARFQYLGKVVVVPADQSNGSDLPHHFALSAAALAGDLLQDGDTVLAVEAAEKVCPEPAIGVLSGQVIQCCHPLRSLNTL